MNIVKILGVGYLEEIKCGYERDCDWLSNIELDIGSK